MGFDEFIGKEDMDVSQDDFLPSGYAKDQVLSRYLISTIADADQYAQAIHNFDAAMKEVFDYCDSYKKYCTPVYAYSNYKEISMENEYISTSKIAPQILRDAGISYNAYFDVIYKSGERYLLEEAE